MAQDNATSSSPTRQFLEEVPARALKFLSAVGRYAGIRSQLNAKGYDDAEHSGAWALLHHVSSFKPEVSAGLASDQVVRDAIADLARWNEPGLRIAGASLKYRHPAQHDFVFEDLKPAQGAAAVIAVSRFLDKLDALESAQERVATRTEDHAALTTLGKRGINAEERVRLRALVNSAQSAVPVPEEDGDRKQDLIALYGWLEEWSEVARTSISRRDYLIALGLVKRRKTKPTPEEQAARAAVKAAALAARAAAKAAAANATAASAPGPADGASSGEAASAANGASSAPVPAPS